MNFTEAVRRIGLGRNAKRSFWEGCITRDAVKGTLVWAGKERDKYIPTINDILSIDWEEVLPDKKDNYKDYIGKLGWFFDYKCDTVKRIGVLSMYLGDSPIWAFVDNNGNNWRYFEPVKKDELDNLIYQENNFPASKKKE